MEHRDVHEGIVIKGNSKRLKGLLEHHSYRNWNDRNLRIEKYSELWAQMKLHKGVKTFMGEGTLRAIWRFFRNYFIKLGFLDGMLGLKLSISIAKEVNLKYKKLYQLLSVMSSNKKLKIIHTEASPHWGGQEIRIFEEMKWFREQGHEMILVAPDNGTLYKRCKEEGFQVISVYFTKPRTLLNILKMLWVLSGRLKPGCSWHS